VTAFGTVKLVASSANGLHNTLTTVLSLEQALNGSMRPSEVVLSPRTPQDSPRTSSDFEEVNYPHNWSSSHEELPLHYMNEDKARRRIPIGSSAQVGYDDSSEPMEYDGEGKDVYTKMKHRHAGIGGGRPRRLPPPPPTSLVCVSFMHTVHSANWNSRRNSFYKT
jgi:hypothetical protein